MISIVMSVYNETIKELNECIMSILNQTYKNFEYVIVDDNPTSLDIKNFLLEISKRDSRIGVIFNKRNMGASSSYNIGINSSKGSLIARIDADDISYPNRLQQQINFMNKNNLDLVCSNCSVITSSGKLIKLQSFSHITQINQKIIRHVMTYCNLTNGPTFLFKRKVFNVIGGYRTNYIDDYDFSVRALIYGFTLGYQSKSLIKKRYRNNSINNSHTLKQFEDVLTISHFLKKTKFKKIIPLTLLKNNLNKITSSDENKFKRFIQLKKQYINKKSLICLIKMFYIIFSSSILFKKFVWGQTIAGKQDKLMKY